ncbi:MAG: phytoene/squalene synthase family protein [Myxococcales bacterium]|nr:phytoene/squalene synthase family protein [Myxococcales bacterium]
MTSLAAPAFRPLAPTPATQGASREICLSVLAEHSKSFALAARLLPPDTRADAAALYAWCRHADDLIDLSAAEAQPAQLEQLESELSSVYAGEIQTSLVLGAFQELVQARGLPRYYAEELLEGMRMDVEGRRYESLDELLLYCHRVAGVVGLMMCHVLGVSDATALRNAAHLGIGMQLTNICRDVLEDWGRGRLYLPRALLEQAGAPGLEPSEGAALSPKARAAVARVVSYLLSVADAFYRSGERGMVALPIRAAFAVRTASHVYFAIGQELRARGGDALAGRVVVPRWKKLLLVVRSALSTLLELRQRRLEPLVPRHHLPLVRYRRELISL